MSTKPDTKSITIRNTKPVRDAKMTSLASAAVSALLKSDETTSAFLYAVSRHADIGRKSSRGVVVTVAKSQHVLGTMTDAYALLGVDKSTGSRLLRRAVLLRVDGVAVAPVAYMGAKSIGALFADASGTLVDGVDAAKVAAAIEQAKPAAKAKPTPKSVGGSESAEGDAPGTGATGDNRPTAATTPVGFPNSTPALITLLEQGIMRLAGKVSAAQRDALISRLAALDVKPAPVAKVTAKPTAPKVSRRKAS